MRFLFSDFQRIVLRELAAIRWQVEETDRRVAALTTRRGIEVNTPVPLPMSTIDHVTRMEEWLETASNFEKLVCRHNHILQ